MHERSRGARLIVLAQWLLLVAGLISSLGLLLLAVIRAGDYGALLAPGLDRLGDPKDSLPSSFLILFLAPGLVVAYFVHAFAFVAVLFGLGALMHSWQVGDRATAGQLLKSTGAWVLVAVAALTPYAEQLKRWLLD